MYYPQNYNSYHKQDPRLTKLKQDNKQLQKALQELNQCYQQKINLLQSQLKKSKQRQQALLEWKSSYIDKELFNNSKYELELQKMVKMMQEMAKNFEEQNIAIKKDLQQKDQEISHLKDQNTYLRQQKDSQQEKIQTLAQKYIVEIERLNNELKELKEQINYDEEVDQSNIYAQNITEEVQNDDHQINMGSIQESILNKKLSQSNQGSRMSDDLGILKDISNQNNNKNLTQINIDQKISHSQNTVPSIDQLVQ